MDVLVRFVNSDDYEELGEFRLKSFMPCHQYTCYRLGSKDYAPDGPERIVFEEGLVVQTIEVTEVGT